MNDSTSEKVMTTEHMETMHEHSENLLASEFQDPLEEDKNDRPEEVTFNHDALFGFERKDDESGEYDNILTNR